MKNAQNKSKNNLCYDTVNVATQLELSKTLNRPIFLLFIATKPCYIKLASVIKALELSGLPHLIVDVGQHYDPELVSAQHEFNYSESISVYLNAQGDLLLRNERLHSILREFYAELVTNFELRQQAIPLVSGDTSSAGIIPLIWYLLTGSKSIHIEAGMRSFSPKIDWSIDPVKDLNSQFVCSWEIKPDQPFPEGMDTRLASICSQLFFAPIAFNRDSLIREGYSADHIRLSGSLSADSIELIKTKKADQSVFDLYPQLAEKKWIRVDVHRRENMDEDRLKLLISALKKYQDFGGNIVLVMSNAINAAIKRFNLNAELEKLNINQLMITPHWPTYSQVIEFITSVHCAGIYTDSGGLQEEANVLKIKCATFRYSTDRPESIFMGKTNVLLPPISAEYVALGLKAIFIDGSIKIGDPWGIEIYGKNVGSKIVNYLVNYTVEAPVINSIIAY